MFGHSLLLCLLAGSLALLPACGRAALSSFVPALDVGVRLTRSAELARRSSSRNARDSSTAMFVALTFRPRSAGAQLPTPSDASGLLALAPCALDDPACLEEVGESEPALRPLQEELP